MKKIILSILFSVGSVFAQDYVYTWETEAVRTACPPYAIAVNVSDLKPETNPEYKTITAQIRQFYPAYNEHPLRMAPEGSLFSMVDGIFGKTIEEINEKRVQQPPLVLTKPLEAPALIVVSATNNYGIGITADDDGNLLTFRAHSSPYDPSVAQSNRAAALLKARDNRAKAKAEMNGQLQQRVENLERLLGVRP